jgi:hypothetical protein
MKELNDYLIEVVKNSKICAECIFNHGGVCFFAYECIKNNYDFRQGDKKE